MVKFKTFLACAAAASLSFFCVSVANADVINFAQFGPADNTLPNPVNGTTLGGSHLRSGV